MKKYVIIPLIIIIIPYLIVTFFIKDETIKIDFISNQIVRVKRINKGTIIDVPLENYVIHVVSSEMPMYFEEEALKAQAVAARSYVLNKKIKNKDKEYDVVDTTSDQVYLDAEELKNKWQDKYNEYINKIKKIVINTKGEYITYNGQIIETFFFSTSNGKTENSEEVFQQALPYLKSVDSSWDKISPAFNNTTEISLSDFYTKLNLPYTDNLDIKIDSYNTSGSINSIMINNKKYTGKEIRIKLELKSTYFDIKKNNNNVIIHTKGYGHGVGMSQYGAQAMALNGKKYDEIIKYYFNGVEISKI